MMQEDSSRAEGLVSTLPLHVQHPEFNPVRRNSADDVDKMAIFPEHSRRLSRRISNTNGGGNSPSKESGNCITNGTASGSATSPSLFRREQKSSLSSLFQREDQKYFRWTNSKGGCFKHLGQQNQLFLMILAFSVISWTFSIYSTRNLFESSNHNESVMDKFFYPSKDFRPRTVSLGVGHFGKKSFHSKYLMGEVFVANLDDLPANKSVAIFEVLSSETEDSPAEAAIEAPANSSAVATEEKKCIPMAKWMTASYPNCNSVHEIDMHGGVLSVHDDEEEFKFLGQGWFRDTWRYGNDNYEGEPPVVLKTLRIEREFLDEYFDLHRRDAVAMERLTFSPYVINVHGFCGQTAINEFAEGILGGKITSLEKLNRRLRGKESDPQALFLKLQLATKVSLALAHVHNIHVSDSSGGRSKSVQSLLYEHTSPNSTHSTTGFGRSIATMAHYDVNSRNIQIMKDGSPKLNDFNVAEFLTYDPETNKPCGFRSRLHEPWWRAPEEMDLTDKTFVDEKVDVYALGEVLFHILTTHGPRGKMKRYRMDEVRELVRQGIPPDMWEPYKSGGKDGLLKKNPIVKAFRKAMDLCFEKDPTKRGTSISVARILHKALVKEQKKRDEDEQKKGKEETWNQ